MESEKVKEIKKALECCTNNKGCEPCQRLSKKPYHLDDCRFVLLTDTLTLINELESENERLIEERDLYKKQFNELEPRFFDLREENKQLKDRIAELESENAKQLEENESLNGSWKMQIKKIAELEKENKDYYDRLNNLQTYIDNHEEIWKGNTNNALNKFAKRLKEHSTMKIYSLHNASEKIPMAIDETLKEFLGEKNDNRRH